MTRATLCLGFSILLLVSCQAAIAQTTRPSALPSARANSPTTLPAGDFEDIPSQRLAPAFTSRAAGISFRPPMGGTQSRRMGFGEEVVQYSNVEEKWSLKLSRVTFDRPAKLLTPDPKPPDVENGILDEAAHQLLLQNEKTEVLRKDVINIGAFDVGLVYSRFTQAGSFWLRQQAFIQANDQLYYVFDFMTPSMRGVDDRPQDEDPAERMAMEIFRSVLDSVRLLDQREIIEDNNKRLYRTRMLQVDLADRIKQALEPDRYFRVMREGKDIGWMYVAEELGEYKGKSAVTVATVMHGQPDENTIVEVSSEARCTLEKQPDEQWLTRNSTQNAERVAATTEFGESGARVKRILDSTRAADQRDPHQPPVREVQRYTMRVDQRGVATPKTVDRDLPPYYLPQALAGMIVRMLPTKDANGYLFVTWVGAEGELIYRYLDVQPQGEVLFDGKTIQAITVKDRIGLEGDATFHYISPEGKYLGSTTAATGVVVVATDLPTIKRLWPDAKIVRPHLLEGR